MMVIDAEFFLFAEMGMYGRGQNRQLSKQGCGVSKLDAKKIRWKIIRLVQMTAIWMKKTLISIDYSVQSGKDRCSKSVLVDCMQLMGSEIVKVIQGNG